jgi:hypothetical protein
MATVLTHEDPGESEYFQPLNPEQLEQRQGRYAQALNRCLQSTNRQEPYTTRVSKIYAWATGSEKIDLENTPHDVLAQERKALREFFASYGLIMDDLLVNIDLLSDGTYSSNPELKKQATELNHRLTTDFFHIGNKKDEDIGKIAATCFYTILDQISEQHPQLKRSLDRILYGARVEAGLMRYFSEQGYTVVVPEGEEIEEWDSKHGIDFITISPTGTILLVDSKGRMGFGHEGRLIPTIETQPLEQAHRDITRDTLRQLAAREQINPHDKFSGTKKTTIFVPSNKRFVGMFGELDPGVAHLLSEELKHQQQ